MNPKLLNEIRNMEGYQERLSFLVKPTFGLDEVVLDKEGRIRQKIYAFRTHTKISFTGDYMR